jgi:hypothetical protein
MTTASPPSLYGLLAEFDDPGSLLAAARAARVGGYTRVDAFSPFPVEGLSEAVGFRRTAMPLIVLLGGLFGCVGGYLMQVYSCTYSYAINVGGKPLHSWPMFLPITFELTVLMASLAGVFGMLALNGFPRLHHPLFNVDRFDRASRDGFFLCVEAADPRFDVVETRNFLQGLTAHPVESVPN